MIGSVSDDISFDALRYALNKRAYGVAWVYLGNFEVRELYVSWVFVLLKSEISLYLYTLD